MAVPSNAAAKSLTALISFLPITSRSVIVFSFSFGDLSSFSGVWKPCALRLETGTIGEHALTATLHFPMSEYDRRIQKTRAEMTRRGFDLLVISDPSNMAWLTGYDGWSFYVHQAVLLGLDGGPGWGGRELDGKGGLRTRLRR